MSAYVYILRAADGKLYVGSTVDIKKRFASHRAGNTQTTRNMQNIELVFRQEYETLQRARLIERRLKKLKRKDYLEKIILDGYIRME